MEIEISYKVNVPDDKLLELAQAVRARWTMKPREPVSVEDLLFEANKLGLVTLPDRWHCQNDDAYLDSELRAIIRDRARITKFVERDAKRIARQTQQIEKRAKKGGMKPGGLRKWRRVRAGYTVHRRAGRL